MPDRKWLSCPYPDHERSANIKFRSITKSFVIQFFQYRFLCILPFLVLCSFVSTRADESQAPRKPEGMVAVGIGSGYYGLTLYSGITYIVNNNLMVSDIWRGQQLNIRLALRRIILIITLLVLLVVAWVALSGGLSQLPRSLTIGQRVETTIQFACGLLSLLSVVTCFYWHRLRGTVRVAWSISLTTAAGMSSVVWGPPMLGIGVVFATVALLVALAVIRLLKVGGA